MKKFIVGALALALLGCRQTSEAPPQQPPASPAVSQTATPDSDQMLTGAQQADVQLDKESYFPGDEIKVTALATGLSDSAWVGVVPTSAPHGKEVDNDSNKLSYVYTSNEGPLTLVAPKEPGDYDIRLNDNDDDGVEVASRSFKVTADPAPVTQPKILWQSVSVEPGAPLEIDFEAPVSFAEDAWIGIIPSSLAHGSEEEADKQNLGYQHLKGRSRARVILTAPSEAGSYDLRMFDTDSAGKEVGSVTFEVKPK